MNYIIIVLGVGGWYGIGLIGSAIAISSVAKSLEGMFPMHLPYNTRENRLICYLMAILGVFNLLSAILFSLLNTHNISTRWEWLKLR